MDEYLYEPTKLIWEALLACNFSKYTNCTETATFWWNVLLFKKRCRLTFECGPGCSSVAAVRNGNKKRRRIRGNVKYWWVDDSSGQWSRLDCNAWRFRSVQSTARDHKIYKVYKQLFFMLWECVCHLLHVKEIQLLFYFFNVHSFNSARSGWIIFCLFLICGLGCVFVCVPGGEGGGGGDGGRGVDWDTLALGFAPEPQAFP